MSLVGLNLAFVRLAFYIKIITNLCQHSFSECFNRHCWQKHSIQNIWRFCSRSILGTYRWWRAPWRRRSPGCWRCRGWRWRSTRWWRFHGDRLSLHSYFFKIKYEIYQKAMRKKIIPDITWPFQVHVSQPWFNTGLFWSFILLTLMLRPRIAFISWVATK